MTPEIANEIAKDIAQHQDVPFSVHHCEAVFGGDINRSYVLRAPNSAYFVKTNALSHAEILDAEAVSLRILKRATEALHVPQPITTGKTADCAYLVLDFITMQSQGDGRQLAQGLVQLHQQVSPNGLFGWNHDNFIGTSPQSNQWHADWPTFWWEERMQPQLDMAYRAGHAAALQPLARQLEARLDDVWANHAPEPSLLHGDLWGGNASFLTTGKPVIYDPASYYGDRETDIAMTELFGGFTPEFYDEYNKLWPLAEGYEKRKKLYNLYHLLNHLNLFGAGYLAQCKNTFKQLNS